MFHRRRLLLQAFTVVGLGAVSLVTAPRAEARTPHFCGDFSCATTCSEALGLVNCAGCGPDGWPQCGQSPWCQTNFGLEYGGYCGADS
jgi:hypothetical protein